MDDVSITRLWKTFTTEVVDISHIVIDVAVTTVTYVSHFIAENLALIIDMVTSFLEN